MNIIFIKVIFTVFFVITLHVDLKVLDITSCNKLLSYLPY